MLAKLGLPEASGKALNTPGAWILIPISFPASYSERLAAEYVFTELEAQEAATTAALADLTVHLIPFVGTIDHFSQGHIEDGMLSLAGDLALGAGALSKVVQGGAQLRRLAATAEMGVAGYRGIQAAQAAFSGQGDKAAMYFGEAVLRHF